MAISNLPIEHARCAEITTPYLARLEQASVIFRDGLRALDKLSLEVAQGTYLGILGPNGAGKTTLLRLLAGLLAPTQGHIALFGKSVQGESVALRRRIGYVAQRNGVDEYLSGRGNLLLAGRLHGLRGTSLRQRTQALLEMLGLAEHAERRVAAYSGGMRRRLALACSLVQQPDLLLLDEPTSGLDTAGKAALWSYLSTLRQTGLTIIAASHDTQEVERYCNRVALLHAGRLILEGAPAMLKASIQGDILTLESGDAQQAFAARQLLQQHPLIQNIHPGAKESQTNLEVNNGSEAIPQITRQIENAGFPIRRLMLSHPTLEDVFFQATGTSLSEADGISERLHLLQDEPTRHKRTPFRRNQARRQRQ
jgi:ABC-2 type transport system ATP-binding protein